MKFASLIIIAASGLITTFCAAQDAITKQKEMPTDSAATVAKSEDVIRFASFNIAMNRKNQGDLLKELSKEDSYKARSIAEVIQRTRPDVLLLCEFDYDPDGAGIKAFATNYLAKSQFGAKPISYPYAYINSVNTGQPTGMDLDHNGKTTDPNDAFGFGYFPGQYAMVVLSQYEIDLPNVRTFQKFLWKDMPGGLWPVSPQSNKPYYSDEVKNIFRLSSKSHWDVPVKVGDKTIHFLTCHPTPPVFDGPEDRNGKRNHDEIRLFADYVSGKADYLYDDNGKQGGLAADAPFVIAGDLNADPADGDSYPGAVRQLLDLPQIHAEPIPSSPGGPYYAKEQGGVNAKHTGDPAFDTADFSDQQTGNMRIDYCLPSKSLNVKASGVYWPKPDQPGGKAVRASDHRMVWIDIAK